jgi:ribonuclease PH
MSLTVTTKKPQYDLVNLSSIPTSLRDTLQPITTYSTPKYKYNVIPSATGSISAEDGHVKCIVGIFGPRAYVSSTGFSDHGIVTCDVSYAPYANYQFSNQSRSNGNKLSHQKSGTEIEISNILQDIFGSVLQFNLLQKHEIFITVSIQQASSCHWYDLSFIVNAISLALTTSGIDTYDMVTCNTIYLLPHLDQILPKNTHDEKDQQSDQNDQNKNDQKNGDNNMNDDDDDDYDDYDVIFKGKKYCLSVYPPTSLLKTISGQGNNANKSNNQIISMTMSYLPSLKQVTFSKLQGQLHNSILFNGNGKYAGKNGEKGDEKGDEKSDEKNSLSQTSGWNLLSAALLELNTLTHIAQKKSLKQFVQQFLLESQEEEENDMEKE